MARITVEDCLTKIESQYDLVLLAKERTSQLNAGDKSLVEEDDDKNTVIALREIGDGKISIKTVEESAINKLRKTKDENKALEDLEMDQEDDFDKIYKGEISKSGVAILPSKRTRKIPEKIIITPNTHNATEENATEEKTTEENATEEKTTEENATETKDSLSLPENKTE